LLLLLQLDNGVRQGVLIVDGPQIGHVLTTSGVNQTIGQQTLELDLAETGQLLATLAKKKFENLEKIEFVSSLT
jgi:hypothetical protein